MKYTVLDDVPCEQMLSAVRVGEKFNLPYFFMNPDGTPIPSVNENDVSVFAEDEAVLQIEKAEYTHNDNGLLEADYTIKAKHTGTTTVSVCVNGVAVKKWEIQVEIDRWRFLNSSDKDDGPWPHAGGYYISINDYFRLVSNLSSVDRAKITWIPPMYSWYNINNLATTRLSFRKWEGSCSGMSRWACLVGSGTLSPELVNQKTLFEGEVLSLEAQSAINFYQHQQQLFSWVEKVDKFMTFSQTEQIEHLKNCAIAAENGGSPIYIGFQWYKDSDTTKPSSHAIVGYGIEDGFWNMEVNGQKLVFTHRILIYDCNSSDVFNSDIYFNDIGTWYIPKYNAISLNNDIGGINNNAQFKIVTNSSALINLIDFESGKVSNAGIGELIRKDMLSVPSDIVYTLFSGEDVYKIGGMSVLESTSSKKLNVILDCNITPTEKSIPTNATVILPNTNSEYTVTTEENAAGFSLDYGNYLESAALNSPGSITFRPNGSLAIQATEATDYGLSITANEGYTPLPWPTISFTGSNATELSTEPVTEGIVLRSDNLSDVTVYGIDDKETKELNFSTQEDSVLITEESDELVILADTDNDGTYETPVTTETPKVTITFDANGGTETPDKATASKNGKLSTLPVPTRSGYTFDGWYTMASGGEKITTDYIFASDTTIYAHWISEKSSQTAPAAPKLESKTSSIVTLVAIAPNENGAAAEYSKDGGTTWQSSPIFTGLSANTEYSFVARYSETKNYAASAASIALKVQTSSSGSTTTPTTPSTPGYNPGSTYIPPTYNITVPTITGGRISISPPSASSGSMVTITTVPDTGYELTSLTVSDTKGKAIDLTGKGSGKYSFRMPNGRVSIEAEFRPISVGVPWSNPFMDVSIEDWYYDAVKFVHKSGLMNGVGNGLFAPNAQLSRAMLAEILYNKEGRPAVANTSIFSDVTVDTWYYDAVAWASGRGIVEGYSNGLFGPSDDITREQLAVMLWRYSGSPSISSKELHFSDADRASSYALDALRWAIGQGILNGKGNGILDPTGKATRAEAAQMLKNYLGK